MAPQLPLTIMQLIGFYFLGRELYHSRLFGFLLTILSFIFVQINLSEFWGYVTSPIPRFSFQAFLPLVLLLVLKNGSNVKRWPFLLALSAATVYLHLVSAPAWSVGILLSLWFMPPRATPISDKLKYMMIALFVFILVLSPFIFKYFQNTAFGTKDENALEEIYTIIDYRLAQGMVDFPTAMEDFVDIVLAADSLHIILFVTSIISLVGMNFISRGKEEKRNIRAVTMWLLGILCVSVLFPMSDFAIAKMLQRNPLEIQFLRALRNFIPLFYILFLWPFAWLYNKGKGGGKRGIYERTIPVLICAGFIILWGGANGFLKTPLLSKTVACWEEGKVICLENNELAIRADFFNTVRELTPPGARILSDDLAIRYYSLRPLAYSKKDGATFSFSNHAALSNWYEHSLVYDTVWQLRGNWNQFIEAYTSFASSVDADYLVIEKAYSPLDFYPTQLQNVYSNSSYSLFKIEK